MIFAYLCRLKKLNMKKKSNIAFMRKIVFIAISMLALSSCQHNEFTVKGSIEGAQDSMLYFDHMTLSGRVVCDSLKLDADGQFEFNGDAPDAPEFYVLRLHNQIINLSIDSTETVTIKAKRATMSSEYEVEGSDNCQKIKELSLLQQELHRKAIALTSANGMNPAVAQDSLQRLIDEYKQKVANDYIFKEPNKAYAYFALFQTLGQWLIFAPAASHFDLVVYTAVATSWQTFYPESERAKNLYNVVMENKKNERIVAYRNSQANETKIEESGIIDMTLPDTHQQLRRLGDLKGKVVLLDFHSFALKDSPQRILMLRDLYNKYHAQGFEIYQVSLDQDEHFWLQKASGLPWICVRDGSAETARSYYVQQVPEYFTISRSSELQKRSSQIQNLEEEIKRLLSFRE